MTSRTDPAFRPPMLVPAPQQLEYARGAGVVSWREEIGFTGPGLAEAERILGPVLGAIGGRLAPASGGEQAGSIDPLVIECSDGEIFSTPTGDRSSAYELHIGAAPQRIAVRASGEEGRRYAFHTLAQLFRQYLRAIPVLRITDWPAIAVRGVMLDISRNRVPTMETLRRTIDLLASLKINHLQLYTEHAFAYTGHEEVWRDASPVTPDEARELDSYCTARGIELSANQNCFGHLHRWLKLPRYAPLAEIPPEVASWTFETDDGRAFTKHGPFSVCPTDPGSMELARDLLGQLLPCFSSERVNINCDEAFDVGQGRSREEVSRRGRAAVYFDHVRAVDAIVKEHGRRSMLWADIALRHPPEEFLRLVPEHCTLLVWGYEADAPFDRDGARLRGLDLPFWVCPGTSSWLSFVGRTSVRRANLASAARAAVSHGAEGMLITDWGDQGHRQPWVISMYSLGHGAHAAWNAARPDAFDPEAAGLHLFGDIDGGLGTWLDDLGEVDAELRHGLRNTNAIYTEVHRPLDQPTPDAGVAGSTERWIALREHAQRLRDRLECLAFPRASHGARDECEYALRLVEHAADKGVLRRATAEELGPQAIPHGAALIRLAADLASIMEDHRSLWHRGSRSGGLDESMSWFERVLSDYEHPGSA